MSDPGWAHGIPRRARYWVEERETFGSGSRTVDVRGPYYSKEEAKRVKSACEDGTCDADTWFVVTHDIEVPS